MITLALVWCSGGSQCGRVHTCRRAPRPALIVHHRADIADVSLDLAGHPLGAAALQRGTDLTDVYALAGWTCHVLVSPTLVHVLEVPSAVLESVWIDLIALALTTGLALSFPSVRSPARRTRDSRPNGSRGTQP